jgi:SAM-dependent methyltransferase
MDSSAYNHTSATYTDGSYLEKTGNTWHQEDSAFKAKYIVAMLARHPKLRLSTVCDIGCGAGGVLAELQLALHDDTEFIGYDISPQAHQLSEKHANQKVKFILGDAFADTTLYSLVLAIDVVEHVENCFEFLRKCKLKGKWKIYHIPLETHATATLRGVNGWDAVGHLHLFTIETALKTVEYSGQRVLDWALTPGALERPRHTMKTFAANIVRRFLGRVSPKLGARLLGGYSILILAE